jgi:hypothetical protein
MKRLVGIAAASFFVIQIVGAQEGRDNIAARVSVLVEAALVKDKETQAFAELETMGIEATPYLVGHLDDMRPLPVQQISLVNNSPKAFEELRHYGPKVVHDALAAILNQVTGQHFVFVYNGASEADRRENIQAWRSWCRSTFPNKTRTCDGGN